MTAEVAGSTSAGGPRRRQHQLALVEEKARPIVKWAGGKGRILDELTDRMPASFGRYFEPFLGGGALFFRISPARAVLGDSNADLVELYREVARDPVGFHARASQIFAQHADNAEGTYYGGREAWNGRRSRSSAQHRAALFLYLNRSCYNGLWRVNRAGEMNVPMGRYPDGPTWPTLPQLVAASSALVRAEVGCADFEETLADARAGDFAYLDPPYLPSGAASGDLADGSTRSATSFVGYTSGGFGVDEHRRLSRVAHDLVRRGVRVMVSASGDPLSRSLYDDFDVACVSAPRAINSRTSRRAGATEAIFTGGYAAEVPS